MRRESLGLLMGLMFVGSVTWAEERDPLNKASEEKLKALCYPGSTLQTDSNLGLIAQYDWVTPDSLANVEAWYRKALAIDKAFIGGVANIPWPAGVKATEAKGQQQWAIVRDDMRLKNDGTRHRDVREGTTRTFLLRTPEQTLLIVLNRGPQDKQTLISATILHQPKR